jgi:uncharacterized iron-regulated protein
LNRVRAATALAFALTLFATACASDPAPPPWQAAEQQNHPLVGRIWDTVAGRFVSRAELAHALTGADFILLGETHDNPDHHRIQAWAVDYLFATGARPGLAIEMIREDQQARFDAYRHRADSRAEGIGPALDWERSGWPAWRHYAPILAPFLHQKRPIIGADLPRDRLGPLVRQGYAALGPGRAAALGLDLPLAPQMLAAMAKEQVNAHCGHIPAARAHPFARIQIARDALMAAAVRKAAGKTGKAVLVAGSGHVRRDRGVPFHLERLGIRVEVLVLAPVEVRTEAPGPESYSANFDYLWFTPRQKRSDPCAELRK